MRIINTGKMSEQEKLISEHRQYLRLDSVFPVSFKLLSLDGKQELSDLLQGFTNNVSKGGICLEINNLKPELASLIKNKEAKLSLNIEIPWLNKVIKAKAQIAWIKDIINATPNKYLIGLSYVEIIPAQNNAIMRYARSKKLFLPVVLSLAIILGLGFAVNSYINLKLIEGNKALVKQLVNIVQESSIVKQQVKQINKEKEDLEVKISSLHLQLKVAEEGRNKLKNTTKIEEKQRNKRIAELNTLIDKLNQDKASFQEKLITVQHQENAVAEKLLLLGQRKATLAKANLDNMYQWLKVHQNPHTGLVISFEGDKDIANWAFIYDQSLAIQAYTYFSDFECARKALEFFDKKAKRMDGKFMNAYYANDGNPAEYTVHSGPNIWLGIAILQYTKKSGDNSYLKLAEEIAREIIKLQNEDKDGGIRGGPTVEWYATEHNLDAYAFFNMLYTMTGKQQYASSRDKVLKWIISNTYSAREIPIKRGKGDSTIATDTYAWSIAAIGPKKLEELGMNPDKIVEFAEQNCAVEVSFTRPDGQVVKIKGFDFAPQQHVARGGVVSSEWTAQMVMAFKIMADFYHQKGMIDKARSYEFKADEYLFGIGKMIISSPSPSGQGESCLPYATQAFVDTGHGWMTPKGNTTGSVAGTAYTIFAYYNYNPLDLEQ